MMSTGFFHGLHKAIYALGYAGPSPKPVHGVMPEIQGGSPGVGGADRALVRHVRPHPKVRGIFRSVMAKAGRWLAAEHPDITEPGHWTRQTCAA